MHTLIYYNFLLDPTANVFNRPLCLALLTALPSLRCSFQLKPVFLLDCILPIEVKKTDMALGDRESLFRSGNLTPSGAEGFLKNCAGVCPKLEG